jgi:hypothetical protein
MGDAALAELRALRSRAYGPYADIDGDAPALRRLSELEALAQHHSMTEHESTPDAGASLERHDEPAPEEALTEPFRPAPPSSPDGEGQEARHADGPPGRAVRWEPRRLLLLWVASLAVAVLVAATASWLVTRKVQASPQQVAVLGTSADQRLPTVFGVDPDGRRFEDYLGLTVFALRGRGWMGGAKDDYCLLLMESAKVDAESNSYSGEIYGGCGAGTFPATVQVRVTDALPDALRAEFPDRSALQFVLGDGEVVVLSDAD